MRYRHAKRSGVSLISITRFVNDKFVQIIENKINLIVIESSLTVIVIKQVTGVRPPAIYSSLIHKSFGAESNVEQVGPFTNKLNRTFEITFE